MSPIANLTMRPQLDPALRGKLMMFKIFDRIYFIVLKNDAPVAQLDRAFDFGSKG